VSTCKYVFLSIQNSTNHGNNVQNIKYIILPITVNQLLWCRIYTVAAGCLAGFSDENDSSGTLYNLN